MRLAHFLLLSFSASVEARAADEPLSFRGSASWYNAYVHGTVTDDARNPGNKALELPSDAFVSQLRPSFKLVSSSLTLIARPRITFEADKVKVGSEQRPYKGASSNVWSEAFAQWTMSEHATLALGKQNYQWGAAESLNPSNALVHDAVTSRTLLYEVTGHNLARLNLSLGKSWSTILIGEYEENGDLRPFTQGETFHAAGLMKNEVNWNSGADYLGVVLGSRAEGRSWVGEYANLGVTYVDGLALYVDARHQKGSDAWHPVDHAPFTAFEQTNKDKTRLYTLAASGLKYDFEGGTSLRGEYVLNDAGYGAAELRVKSRKQLLMKDADFERALTPGLELDGRRYAFLSLYAPDLVVTDLNVYARALFSLTDRSSSSYASVEYALKDAGTLLASASVAAPKAGELRGFLSPAYTAGYKHLW